MTKFEFQSSKTYEKGKSSREFRVIVAYFLAARLDEDFLAVERSFVRSTILPFFIT